MNVVLLSGGSGKRLWPLSNGVRSKQFIKIFKTEQGNYESMLQRVYRQIKSADEKADIVIATSKTQVSTIHNQLGENIGISVEPCRRDTFPAIALATAFLTDVRKIDPTESVVVCPVDLYVEEDYFKALKALIKEAEKGKSNLVLLGIEPTYPSEKYGYIIPENEGSISKVNTFKEKPDVKTAERYLKQGALWNAGVFAYKLQYILDKVKELTGYCRYDELLANYTKIPKISLDYAVVEKERNIQVMRFNGIWKDIGSWNTLVETMDENLIGDARTDGTCSDVHVINNLDIPILALGLHNVIISASPEGILVSDKKLSSSTKPFVDRIHQQAMIAEKSWGTYRVLEISEESMTIKVVLKSGEYMNYHSHDRRDEVWTIVSGAGRTIVDGVEQSVKAGDVVRIKAGCCHTVIADTELQLIEVQIGKDISVADKIKYDFPI